MAQYPYLVLENSNSSISKRFRAITMSLPRERTDSFSLTLGGKWDKAAGTIIKRYRYTLKIYESDPDPLYGDYDDFIALFDQNSPAGTPSDLLTLTDHYGVDHYVKFQDSVAPEPATTQLVGPSAIYFIPISLIEFEVVSS